MKQYKNTIRSFNKTVLIITCFVASIFMQSCSDYLDVVPDNVATLDNSFKLRNEAEKYLFTCYSFLPKNGDINFNIGLLSGDEMWIRYQTSILPSTFEIARGNQRVSNPLYNVWGGNSYGGGNGNRYNIFIGIRHCNIFLDNIKDLNKVPDLEQFERSRWIAEVEFLKAYYHYYLLRMYGPIPIIDVNVPLDAPEDQINVERKPFDECVTFIVNTLDAAIEKLPEDNAIIPTTEAGRVSRTIALAVKAKVLLLAASPLYNGNTELANFVGNKGENLISTTFDENKWRLAADAALEAIQSAEANGKILYEFPATSFNLSDETMTQMSVRQAVTERWNREVIWANPNDLAIELQRLCMPPLDREHNHNDAKKVLGAPLKMARLFYTENGVPLSEDKTFIDDDFSEDTRLRTASEEDQYNIKPGYRTARLNFNREPRFYANLGFDGGIWYKQDSPSKSDTGNVWYIEGKFGDYAGASHPFFLNATGYFIKKLVNWRQVTNLGTRGATYESYPWPEIRLADLYLMYAEALNEIEGPVGPAFTYLDRIRERAGLKGVQESWSSFSNNPNKPSSKEGLREIIHQERMIELAFEGKRFWDLRRWKKAALNLNRTITGLNVEGEDEFTYYQEVPIFQQTFISPRDYFWPIPEDQMIKNLNLVQNPGW